MYSFRFDVLNKKPGLILAKSTIFAPNFQFLLTISQVEVNVNTRLNVFKHIKPHFPHFVNGLKRPYLNTFNCMDVQIYAGGGSKTHIICFSLREKEDAKRT